MLKLGSELRSCHAHPICAWSTRDVCGYLQHKRYSNCTADNIFWYATSMLKAIIFKELQLKRTKNNTFTNRFHQKETELLLLQQLQTTLNLICTFFFEQLMWPYSLHTDRRVWLNQTASLLELSHSQKVQNYVNNLQQGTWKSGSAFSL